MIAEAVMCLALNLYHEAKSESYEGQLAVAHVVMNRTKSSAYPSSVCDVVWQGRMGTNLKSTPYKAVRGGCQFSWTCDGRPDEPKNVEKFERMQEIAELVLEGKTKDPTRGAIFFHNTTVVPAWAAIKTKTRQIGQHIFYR